MTTITTQHLLPQATPLLLVPYLQLTNLQQRTNLQPQVLLIAVPAAVLRVQAVVPRVLKVAAVVWRAVPKVARKVVVQKK